MTSAFSIQPAAAVPAPRQKPSGAGWFIVEQDVSVGRTALEAAKMSADYVNGL